MAENPPLNAEYVAGEPPVSDHVMCGNCGPWERHADDGECRYCGHVGKVKREPFGGVGRLPEVLGADLLRGGRVTYDSRIDTLRHIQRVQELLTQAILELVERGNMHDRSKLEDPELAIFDEYTPKLKHSTYGSDEYKGFLKGMGAGLAHHYEHNRHHPEHFANGVTGMTLIDLIEMLADWKAATERHADGDMERSLRLQKDRFQIEPQLMCVLWNTARAMGWVPAHNEQPAEAGKAEQSDGAGDGD